MPLFHRIDLANVLLLCVHGLLSEIPDLMLPSTVELV